MIFKLLLSTLLSLSIIFSESGNNSVKSFALLERDCESIDNQEECFAMGCDWTISYSQNGNDLILIEECVRFESEDTGGWNDECSQLPQDLCDAFPSCLWNEDLNQCVRDNEGGDDDHNDGPPECLMDCEGIENVDPEENPYESCDWIISNFGPYNFMNQCAEDCDNEIMMEINEYMEVCFQCLADNNCEDIFDNEDDWDDECSEFPQDLCDAFPFCSWDEDLNQCIRDNEGGDDGAAEGCMNLTQDECSDTENCMWISGFAGWTCVESDGTMDDGGWNDDGGWVDECSEFPQDLCNAFPFCSWDEDLNQCVRDNEGDDGGWNDDGGWDDGGGDGEEDGGWVDECSEFPQDLCNAFPFCSWDEDLNQCVRDNEGDDGGWNDDGGEDGGDFEVCSDLTQDECTESEHCNWTIVTTPNGVFEMCIESNDWNDDGGWDDGGEDCNADLICAEMITCWENGFLYSTTCGPENCDMPIGPCDDGEDDGGNNVLCSDISNPFECIGSGCEWVGGNIPGAGYCVDESTNDCDPNLICGEMISCWENGFLYPTTCGPENCDMPIGPCDDGEDDGGNNVLCSDINNLFECIGSGCEWVGGNMPGQGYCVEESDEDCNPDLMCGGAITCWEDGLLYPSTCGPENCDLPIGECEDIAECEDGEINNDNPCNPMECYDGQWFEIIVDCAEQMGVPCEGGIYVDPLEGECCSTCVEYEQTAILRLGHVVGNPGSETTVPLFLDSNFSNVGGLQFTIKTTGSDNIADYVIPAGIVSMEDCFTADFNNLDGTFIGIVFSLSGCSYDAGNNIHIADLVYELLDSSEIGNDAELVFESTIVSDPSGTELPSSGQGGSILIGMLADINGDGNINVLDVVLAVGFAIATDEPSESEFWASDINQDGMINVLDIVQLVSVILESDNGN